ncbi:unnamed protein product [Lepeophtheirus salmonis]|uniref:(salmon louse) hypothetical protein n=1 Tax=Lepeophtheirus salmonis TaxID=72036 RepID=A0A7R8D2Z5_LEPSM|nr:unnamed protein product [Lepeophtheirus salmonis]CAF3010080.1 unnamed protein product [Lepeophtheirus salmonis]
MSNQETKKIEIAALLREGVPHNNIKEQVGASLKTIYNVSNRLEAGCDLKHSPGADRKPTVSTRQVKPVFKRTPNRSIADMARKMGTSRSTVSRAMKRAEGKSVRRTERPLLTERQREVRLGRAKKILNDIKSSSGRIIIFSDEKTFTVDPVFNRQNDRVGSFGDVQDKHRYVATTKHPASVMMLGLVASNGKAMKPVWSFHGSNS